MQIHSTAPVTAVSNWQWLLAEIAVSDPSLIWFRLRKLKLTQGNKTMKKHQSYLFYIWSSYSNKLLSRLA